MKHAVTSSSESTGDVVAFLRQGVSDTGSVALADCAGPPCTYHSLFETLDTVDASAAGFLPDGLSGRARIMTVLPDGAPTAVILLALLNRATLVPANPDFTVSELSRLATNSGSTGLAILGEDPAGQAAAEALNLPVLRFDRRQASHCADVRLSRDCGAIPPAAEVSDTRLILTTSGSTGDPKAVPLTAEALFLSARNIAETLALTEEDIGVHFLPMFHIGALVDLLLAPLSAGGAVQIVKRHPLADMITSVAESGCTWLQAVPTMLRAILSQADERELARIRSRLRFVRSVSSDLPAGQHEDAEARLGVPVIQMYGMTETAGQIASMELPPAPRRPGSVGRILGPEVTILDTAGNPVRPGDTGEICVAGPTVMRGYLGTPPGTGFFGPWLRTGDLGRLEGDGTLFLTGRVKELINRGGEKISPREIESFLLDHDGVAEAVVFARPHPTLGEEPCAAVVLDKDAAATAEDLLAHLARHLAPHKLPRHLDILQELPRLGSGKIDRRAVANAASPAPRPKARISGGADVKRLSDIWAAVLSTEAPEWDDDFFDMGGDSLLATNLVLRVERALGRDLPPGILFEAPTFGEPIRITSVSGHCLDLNRFDDIRVVRFIRDPRDLLVSGYHYHLRGAEHWCHVKDPSERDWSEVRGAMDGPLPEGESLTSYLERVPPEDGLRTELAFRRYHFQSMREWPEDCAEVRTFRYEDILGNEAAVFQEIFEFFGTPRLARLWGLSYARRHAAGRAQARRDHIRNPKAGQWRDTLPQDVIDAIARDYGDVLERYGYPLR